MLKSHRLIPVIVVFLGMGSTGFAINFKHTAKTVQPSVVVQQQSQVQVVEPAAVACGGCTQSQTPAPCTDCNEPYGFQMTQEQSVPKTSATQKVHELTCTKIDYEIIQYQDYEPQLKSKEVKYEVQETVPYTAYGTHKAKGYKLVPEKITWTEPRYKLECRCVKVGCRWVERQVKVFSHNVTMSKTILKKVPYTYDKDYSYTAYKTEPRIKERTEYYTVHKPVTREREIAKTNLYKRYVNETVHKATVTYTTKTTNELSVEEGKRLFEEQQRKKQEKMNKKTS